MIPEPPPMPTTVWVQRAYSPALALLAAAALILERRHHKNKRLARRAVALVAGICATLALGTVRVVVNADGLTVGFGPWGWPQLRFPLSRIISASVEHGLSATDADLRENLVRAAVRLAVGIGYRFTPTGTRVVLGFDDILVIRLDSGRTFGVTAPHAGRAADLINAAVEQHAHPY